MTVIRRDNKGNEVVVRGRKPRDVRDTAVVTRELLKLIDTKCTFAVNVKGDHTTGFTLEFVNLDITEELECRTRGELNAMLRTLYYMHHRSIEPMYDRLVEAQRPDQAGTLESVIEDRDRYKRLYEDWKETTNYAAKTIEENALTIKRLEKRAMEAESMLKNVAVTLVDLLTKIPVRNGSYT
jgi:hypothetical protein